MSSAKLLHLVHTERRRRGWSARQAALEGGINNTTWSRFESGETELTPRIRTAVARAFGWPLNWPDDEVADLLIRQPTGSELLERLSQLADQVEALAQKMTEQQALLECLLSDVRRDA